MTSANASHHHLWPATLRFHELPPRSLSEHLLDDENLLKAVDADASAAALAVWEAPSYAVVLGRSNLAEREVFGETCAEEGVPVQRRCSGGGAVVIGPGCLCYALALPIGEHHRSLGVGRVTAQIMQRTADALSRPGRQITVRGTSDLVLDGRKFSGNSQRWLRQAILHHGTILYDFDLARITRYLQYPSRVPEYREERPHDEFVRNIDLPRDELIARLRSAWHA